MEEKRGVIWGILVVLALGAAFFLAGGPGGPGVVGAWGVDPPVPPPTNTFVAAPTATARPTETPGRPTATPSLRPTDAPPLYESHVSDVPPSPIAAPWVGVVDYLLGNVCLEHGGETYCFGQWIANSNPSLYEDRGLRENTSENGVSEGDRRPTSREDDVHIARPKCLVGSEWKYVAGTWYYNGLADVVVEPHPYGSQLVEYRYPTVPRGEEFDVLVYRHHAYVPTPAYPGATAWNFGADYTCEQGGGEPPPPPPAPTPAPPPAGCPACSVMVFPRGTWASPYLSPLRAITVTWDYGPAAAGFSGYTVSLFASDGSAWWLAGGPYDYSPGAPQRLGVEPQPGLIYRLLVQARFEVGGREGTCCEGETYLGYAVVLAQPVPSLGARVEYWSEHDRNYPFRGPGNPYRTSGAEMFWNYGEVLHAHPSAEWEEPEPPAGWSVRTEILRWRYLGSRTASGWHAAACARPGDGSCGWQEESRGRRYLHLRWYKYLRSGEREGMAEGDSLRWVYATAPDPVSFGYEVAAETRWSYPGREPIRLVFTETLTMTVDLQYPVSRRFP